MVAVMKPFAVVCQKIACVLCWFGGICVDDGNSVLEIIE